MCIEAATPEIGELGSAACVACACMVEPDATSECDEMCWGLMACVVTSCAADPSDTACIVSSCASFLGGASAAMAVLVAIDGACRSECPEFVSAE